LQDVYRAGQRSIEAFGGNSRVGDLFMSLIHTCESNRTTPDYLTELQKHAKELARKPAAWMPWIYRQTLPQAGAGGNPV